MLRSTCTFLGASSARAAGGRVERGHPRANPPSITTAVSSAVVRSRVGLIMISLLLLRSLDDDDGVHLVRVQAAGDGVGVGRDGRRLLVVASAGEPAAGGRAARPLAARGDEVG